MRSRSRTRTNPTSRRSRRDRGSAVITDTSEKGLGALIVAQMTGRPAAPPEVGGFAEEPEPFVGLDNWVLGDPRDYDRA